MQKLVFDLSGIKGLAPRFYGDEPYTSSNHNLRYLGEDGQFAEGIFNPINTLGYLSPANNTTKTVSSSSSSISNAYCLINERTAKGAISNILVSDRITQSDATAGTIRALDTNIDTSFSTLNTILTLNNPNPIFKAYSASNYTFGVAHSVLVQSSATTLPDVIYKISSGTTGGSTTQSVTVAVPDGTNKCLVVFAMHYTTGTAVYPSSASWNSQALTAFSLGSSATTGREFGYGIFYLINPTTTSSTLTVTWGSSVPNRHVHAIVLNNVNQTTPLATAKADSNATPDDELWSNYTAWDSANETSTRLTLMMTNGGSANPLLDTYPKTQTKQRQEDTTNNTSQSFMYRHPTHRYHVTDMVKYQINNEPHIIYGMRNHMSYGYKWLGTYNLKTSTFNDGWSSWDSYTNKTDLPTGGADNLASPNDTILTLSDNGLLYACNGNKVFKIDGGTTGGTYGSISEVLLFLGAKTIAEDTGVITRIQDAMDYKSRMWIGIHVDNAFNNNIYDLSSKSFPSFVGVYVWNRISTRASMSDFIEIVGVKEFKSLHKLQGRPCCFTIGVNGDTQLRMFNNTEFEVVKSLPPKAYPNFRKHSVYEGGNYIMWFGNDGKVYFYGKFEPDLENALYILGDFSDKVTTNQTFSEAGVFIPSNATETNTSGNKTVPMAFYLGYKDTAGTHFRKWYPFATGTIDSVAQIGNTGNVYTLVKYVPDMSNIKYVDIRCAPTSTGSTVIATVKYYFNGSTTASVTKTITLDQASRGYVRHEINKPYVNAIQMEIEFNNSQTMGRGADFRPSVAIVNYEDTPTKG